LSPPLTIFYHQKKNIDQNFDQNIDQKNGPPKKWTKILTKKMDQKNGPKY
jgi:hypothetical protein